MDNKLDSVARVYIYPLCHGRGGVVYSAVLLFNMQRAAASVVNGFIRRDACDTVGCYIAPVKRLAARGIFKIEVRVVNALGFCERDIIDIHIHRVRGV